MSSDPWLNEKTEWTGHWWLPDDPEEPRPGVLHYEPEQGLHLSLIGGFEERILRQDGPGAWAVLEGSKTWNVILGVADNREVTLLDCSPTKSMTYGMSLGQPAKQTIHAQSAVVGVHLADEDDRVFTGCEVSMEGLTDWSASSVFSMTMGTSDGKLDGRGTVQADPVDGLRCEFGTTTFRLEHHQTMPFFEQRRGSTVGRMTDAAIVYVEPDQLSSLVELRRIVRTLQDLLSLATHRAAAVLWLTLRLPPSEGDHPDGHPVFARVASVYSRERVLGDQEVKSSDRGYLFTCADLAFDEVVPRWLRIRDRFAATVNLILGMRYVPGGYLETQLSQAVTAAEAMHRALGLDPPIPAEEFKDLKKAVLDSVPKARRDWAGGLLARNEPSLRTRLLDLASRPDAQAMETLLPDPERWARMTVAARNTLTHTGRSTAHDLHELYAVSRVTVAVVLLNLLQEVGVPDVQQRAILTENSELRTACRLSREHCVLRNDDK